ncbi:hypothetical protein DFH07DRAFT_784451, partial [Mycena maculata]
MWRTPRLFPAGKTSVFDTSAGQCDQSHFRTLFLECLLDFRRKNSGILGPAGELEKDVPRVYRGQAPNKRPTNVEITINHHDQNMAPTRLFKTEEDYYRHQARLENYRQYRRTHREQCRAKGRERMARLCAAPTEEQRAKHREAQARYREQYREQIAHRARRAAAAKNAAAGKETKRRPKAHGRLPHVPPLPQPSRVQRGAVVGVCEESWGRGKHRPRSGPERLEESGIVAGGRPRIWTKGTMDEAGSNSCSSPVPAERFQHHLFVEEEPLHMVFGAESGGAHGGDGGRARHGRESFPAGCKSVGVAPSSRTVVVPGAAEPRLLVLGLGGWKVEGHSKQRGKRRNDLPGTQHQPHQLTPTHMSADEVVMDERGFKDPWYYCLPPFRGDRTRVLRERRAGRYPFHLVAQGHIVGTFDNWPEAKASITGYLDCSHQGCYSEEECIEVWQRLCVLGVHPHAVDPTYAPPCAASMSGFVNTSPRKTRGVVPGSASASPVKKEGGSGRPASSDPQLLADLKRYCSPILPASNPSPRKGAPVAAEDTTPLNFAIRGGGIVSSSAVRSAERYLELQRRGEEPDMLVTRSLQDASLFALEDGDD